MADRLIKRETPDPEAEAFLAAVQEGIDDADAGRTVPYEGIRRWLLSWGVDRELRSPRRR